jgi:hypothetical protein
MNRTLITRTRRTRRFLAAGAVLLATGAGACTPDDGGGGDPTPTTAAPVTESFCDVAAEWVATLPRNAAGGAQGPESPAPADVASYFRTNTEYLGRLDALSDQVPTPVAEALARLHDASVELLAELEEAEFDFSVAAANASDPDLRADRQALEDYLESTCGVSA